MKIYPKALLYGLNSEPIKETDKSDSREISLRDVVTLALMGDYSPHERPEWKEKMDRYDLAVKFKNEDELDLDASQVALIERLLALRFPPLIVGAAHYAMESQPPHLSCYSAAATEDI